VGDRRREQAGARGGVHAAHDDRARGGRGEGGAEGSEAAEGAGARGGHLGRRRLPSRVAHGRSPRCFTKNTILGRLVVKHLHSIHHDLQWVLLPYPDIRIRSGAPT
jgi:hypothetical protein